MTKLLPLRWVACIAILGLLLGGWMWEGGLPAARGQDAADSVNNIFPVAPRELRQHLTRAQAAVEEERYSDAVAELGEILNSPEGDDYFLGAIGSTDAQISIKTQALALLGSMPAKGRALYELQYGAEAKKSLEDAIAAGDLVQLTEVSRRFFHTKAGYEATLLLGRIQLDQGRPLAAALTLKRVADVPFAAAQFDPELSILMATCWVHANQSEKATETLVALKQRLPNAKVRLIEGEVPLFPDEKGALTWLEEIVGDSRVASVSAATQWVLYRGNETRNAVTEGGVPLLNFNWKHPTVYEPSDGEKVVQLLRATRDRNEPVIPALQPLVVQDFVIVRHPEANRLAGINLKNGKIIWTFPPYDDPVSTQQARPIQTTGRTPITNVRELELKQRVWEDNAFGQISSDGRQVYVIDELGYAPMSNVNMPQVFIAAGGRRLPNQGWSRPHNELSAISLKREGAIVWSVGGTKGDQPALSGAFFLGAPLPLGDQLFAMAELNGEIRLVALNSKDGSLEWKQQLAVLDGEYQFIVNDRVRRLAGASPSYADGILVCPTSAGAVVGVDLATRSLRWGYQYSRWDQATRRSNGVIQSTQRNPNASQGNWLDSTATIAGGSVVLTPVESQELHCLDLFTGKARWPAKPRDEMLFVACIHDGKIILVGQNKLKAVKLEDGADGWSAPVELGDDMVTGRGYYSGKQYFLPVSGQHLLKIDLDEGKIVGRAKTEVELGNVVCYQDHLITQSPQTVAAFFLSEPLQARLAEDLKANPNDPKALALKGQVLLQEGQAAESLDVLRRAHEHAPGDKAIRSLLVKVMLALLRDDFSAHIGLTDELEKLVVDPAQRREVLRWRVKGLAKTGRTLDAFRSLMELVDYELEAASGGNRSSAGLESIERDLAVRGDRWLQGRIHEILKAADSDNKELMDGEIQTRLERVLGSGNAGQLRAFLNLFGSLPASHAARLALAEQLIGSEQFLEAEFLVGDLLEASDRTVAGSARATLAVLYEKAKRFDRAARCYRELGAQFGDVVCRDNKTGAELARQAEGSDSLKAHLAAAWPTGQTEVGEPQAAAGAASRINAGRGQSYSVDVTEFGGAAPRGLKVQYDPNQYLITVRDDLGVVLANASLRGSDGSYRRYYAVPYYALTGKANGHLVAVNLGSEVVAIDALRADSGASDRLLWRQEAVDFDVGNQRVLYPQQRSSGNPLTGTRYVSHDPSGRLNFHMGMAGSGGLCFQKGRQLICVDPLTGQSLWERGQMPPQAEMFGDGELLFVADVTGEEVFVLSAIDGTLLGKRKIDKADRRWATNGRRVLAWDQAGAAIKLRLYDAWQPEADLWSHQMAVGTRGTIIDGEELALLEPGGQFTIVSLETGEVRYSVPLDPEPSLAYIHVQRSSGQYILMTNQENPEVPPGLLTQPLAAANSPQARVHGRVYAFDRRTGKLQWQVPAFVAMHALPPEQPAESPLLFFVRKKQDTTKGAGGQWHTSVLVLDKRDGRVAFDSDNRGEEGGRSPLNDSNHCDIVVDPVQDAVTFSILSNSGGASSTTLVFKLTDKPGPPQPPAQTGAAASDKVGQLPGTVDPSVGAAIEALNRGVPPAALIPKAPAPR